MPKNYRNSKKYSRKRSQYRQQKLAVATVKNIAREIAQKEDRKNQVWFVDKRVIPGAWTSYGGAPLDITKYQDLPTDNIMYSMNLSNPGKYVMNTNINMPNDSTTGYGSNMTCGLRYRAIQAHLRFVNTDNFTRTVRCALVYVPNLNLATLSNDIPLQPQRWWLGDTNGKYKGIFRKEMKYRSQDPGNIPEDQGHSGPGINIRILDQKVIKLPPPTVYDVKGATVDDIIQHHIKEVSLSHYFKGLGKKEKFIYEPQVSTSTAQMLASGNYRLLIASDEPDQESKVKFYGVAGCKFRVSDAPINISNSA